MLNIILFGPPGSGKGTQSENLIKKYDLVHLSTGDIFRYNMKNDTELGQLAKRYISAGDLVPDEVTINMLKAEVEKHEDPKGFIFDGFPRTIPQAVALDEYLGTRGDDIVVLELEVPDEELIERLKNRALTSGRTDDADPEVINNRLSVYYKETAPVAGHYSEQGKHAKVDGVGSLDDVASRLYHEFDACLKVNG